MSSEPDESTILAPRGASDPPASQEEALKEKYDLELGVQKRELKKLQEALATHEEVEALWLHKVTQYTAQVRDAKKATEETRGNISSLKRLHGSTIAKRLALEKTAKNGA